MEDKKIKEALFIPLDFNTNNQLKKTFSQLFNLFEEKNFREEVGCAYTSGFLIFKSIEKNWIVIWAKRGKPLTLLRMEIELIIDEVSQRNARIFKRLKLWS